MPFIYFYFSKVFFFFLIALRICLLRISVQTEASDWTFYHMAILVKKTKGIECHFCSILIKVNYCTDLLTFKNEL